MVNGPFKKFYPTMPYTSEPMPAKGEGNVTTVKSSSVQDNNLLNGTHITIVNQGVDFIIGNLFDKITVNMIADHCCFSRYYFNRLFKSVIGESLYSFIKRLRIETAAFKLIKFPNLRITRVAAELGYSSSNFTVLFKKYYGISVK